MREIVHIQAGQCGNQIGAKVKRLNYIKKYFFALKIVSKMAPLFLVFKT